MARYSCRNDHSWTGVSSLSPKFDREKDLVCGECGAPAEPKMKRGAPMRRVSEKRAAEEAAGARPRSRGSTLTQTNKGLTASPAQRAKVEGTACVGCGREATEDKRVVIDPAHVWPQGKGGCKHPDCVLGLCRGFDYSCHTLFDEGRLDLLKKVSDRPELFAVEIAHPIACHRVTLIELVTRLAGNRHQLVWVERETVTTR